MSASEPAHTSDPGQTPPPPDQSLLERLSALEHVRLAALDLISHPVLLYETSYIDRQQSKLLWTRARALRQALAAVPDDED